MNPEKQPLWRRILKAIGLAASLGFVLIALLAAFTQTDYFRDRIRIILVSSLTDHINGSVRLGALGGNFLTGITADSLEIYYRDKLFLKTGRILCQYDPLTFFEKKAALTYFIIEQPRIHFVKGTDGKWNYSQLFKPSGPSRDTSHGPFDWNLNLADLQLKNGIFTVLDSTSPATPRAEKSDTSAPFDYGRFALKDINVQAKALFRNEDLQVHLTHTSFYSDHPQFELTHCSGEFALSAKGITAGNVIIQSGRSYVELDGALKDYNIFRPSKEAALMRDSTRLKLRAKNVDLGELRTLIPPLGFLAGSAFVDLAADGVYGDLTIKRMAVQFYQNTINVSGTVRNLQVPDRLRLDLFVGAPSINPADVPRTLPGLGLPKFDKMGRSSLYVQFAGTPLNFRTKTILKGGFGDCEFAGTMNFERKDPVYDLTFTTSRLNLAALVSDPRYSTVLSSTGSLKGEGVTFQALKSSLVLRIDSSRVRNLPVNSARLTLEGKARRFEGTVDVASQSMKATVTGHVDLSNESRPDFGGDVSLHGINIGTVIEDPKYESDITIDGTVAGSGKTIDDFSADAKLTLFPSTFQSHSVAAQEIRFFLDQNNPESKRLSLQSAIMDMDLNGKFDLDLAAGSVVHQTENLLAAIQEHALPPESIRTKPPEMKLRPHTPAQRRLDFDYTMRVKDLEPIATLIEGRRFDGRGTLSGAIHGTDEMLSFTCNGNLDEFYIGSYEKGFLLNNTSVAIRLDSLTDVATLDRLSAGIQLGVGSGLVNALNVDSFKVALGYHQYKGTVAISGIMDSLYGVTMVGQTSVQPHTYVFDFDSLTVRAGEYRWRNDQDVQMRLDYDGTRVMHGLMGRNGEQLSLTGVLHHNGAFDFDAILKNYDLAALPYLTRNKELLKPDHGFQGRTSAEVHLSGSTTSPLITFRATCDSMYYRRTRIGSVAAQIGYRDSLATLDIVVRKMPQDQEASLVVKGTLPINLAFAGVKDRFPDQPQHIKVVSEGFDLAVLDPLLTEVDNLTGVLHADLTVAGTPRDPEYQGSVTLNDVNFVFTPNNVAYSVSAVLEPARNKIVVQSLTVKNFQRFGPSGEARLSGFLTVKNYQVDSLDLTAFGQILLMTDATQRLHTTIYGPLPTATGPDGLHLVGTLQHPYLSGKLYLQGANLTSPPVVEAGGPGNQLALNYIVVDDTTKATPQGPPPSKFYAGNEAKSATAAKPESRIHESTFLDRLRYDVSIETRGSNAIKMIFTPSTNEELYAELDGTVSLINSNGTARLTGEVIVSPNSYYNFFRRFDASGKLKFVGQWDNPELDIQATYEGYRTDPAHDSLQQKVIVQLNITGTRYEPKLVMSMKVQMRPGEDPVDWSTQAKGGDVQSDALSFILTGKFRDDLTPRERGDIASSVGSTAGSGFTSGLLSGVLTDFLRQEFPFIRNAEVTYEGGGIQQGANVRLSGEAFKGYWQVGGKILNDIGNANVSYQMSLGDVLKASSIHNLFLEIQRRVEGDLSEEKKLTNEARLYYRFSF